MADPKLSKAQLIDALRASQSQLAALQAEVLAKSEAEANLQIIEAELAKTREALAIESDRFKETEKRLKNQQTQYEAFLEHSAEGIWRLDCVEPFSATLSEDEQIELFYAHGLMGECNTAMANMYGFSEPSEIIGIRLGDLLVKSEPQNIDMLRTFIRSGHRLTDYESHEVDKDGNPKYFLNNFSGIIKDNQVLGCWGAQRDITERKRLALELSTKNSSLEKESEERKQIGYELLKTQLNIHTLLDALPDLLFRVAKDGTYLAFKAPRENRLFEQALDLVGKKIHEVLPADVAQKAMVYIEQALATGELQKFDYELITNGKTRWYEARIVVSGAEEVTAIVRDITETRMADQALRESEERFSKAFHYSPLALSILSMKDFRYLYMNAIALKELGYTEEEVIGRTPDELHLWADETEQRNIYKLFTSNPSIRDYEIQIRRKHGEVGVVLLGSEPITINGDPCLLVTANDITKRVIAEKALRESEGRFQSLAKSSPVGIYRLDKRGRCVYINERWSEIVGFDAEAVYGYGWIKAIHPHDRDVMLKIARELSTLGEDFRDEYRFLRPDGTSIWVYGQAVPERDARGEVIGYVGTLTDITARKQTEAALRESEAKFRVIAESSVGVVMLYDRNSFIYVNPATEAITGYSCEELLQMSPWDIIHPSYKKFAIERWQSRLEGKPMVQNVEYKIITKSGEERWVEFTAGDFINYQGKSVATATAFDITERKRAEEMLAAEKERLAITLRSIGDGVIATDIEERVMLINRVAEKLTGWNQEEAIGKPLSEVFHIINESSGEVCESPAKKAMQSGQVMTLASQTVLVSKSGKEYPIADSGAPIRDQNSKIIGVVLVFRDTSIERQREEELLKASKLESIGILAGGIAHDFNNILTAISGNLSLARRFIEPQNKAYLRLNETEVAILRAKDLTQQLLTFARGGAPIKRTSSITPLLEETVNFALSGSNIQSEIQSQADLWLAEIDEGQISQVIHNLILNARQAMPLGGKLEIAAQNIYVDSRAVIQGIQLRAGKYIKITVQDEGVGIAEEYLTKIFDPYFTTKQRGSGLGLATAYSIIKKHEGYIFVESALRTGATFSIYLPASDKSLAPKTAASEPVLLGRGKILVMDDEEPLRNMIDDMLTYLGYEFAGAASGEEAIGLYRQAMQSNAPFDAVLMDLTVPGKMGGEEAVKKILALDPQAKCIVSSGYSTAPVMAEYKKYGFVAVIAKPFQITDLNEVLQHVLLKSKEKI
jgi:PAS domain S-box-containing protein